jgi:hypothetical protein
MRQYINGEFHVEGDLVIAGKDRLFMYFKNPLPLLRMLDGKRVVFLIPLPLYILAGCCDLEDYAPNRSDPTSRPTPGLASGRSEAFSRTFCSLTI